MYKKIKDYWSFFVAVVIGLLFNCRITVFAAESDAVSTWGTVENFVMTVVVVFIACLLYNFLKKNGRK